MAFVTAVLSYFLANPSLPIFGVLVCLVVWFLSTLFSRPKAGPNPFEWDCSRPPKPDVLDQAERDKVLKQGFTVKKVPDKLDAIVVGSGIGGLTTAAILAKVGKRVLVLEQHDQAGGCCHTFVEKGFEFDVGIHYVGEMYSGTDGRVLIDQLTEGQLQWEKLCDEFDVCAIGPLGKQKLYPLRAGSYESWQASVIDKFPEEEEAIKKFVEMLKEVKKNIRGKVILKFMPTWMSRLLIMTGLIDKMTSYFKYSKLNLREVLDSLTDNQDLKTVLSYCHGDYGVPPGKASFATQATVQNHFMFGAFYPRGGASEVAFHIIPVIERTGGKVNDIDKTLEEYTSKSLEEAVECGIPVLFISFPSSKDPTFNKKYPGKTVCTIVTAAYWESFAPWVNERVKKRGDDYEALKNRIGERMWQQTCSLLPQLEGKVKYFEVGTPVTNQFYLNAPKGEIYGLDHDQTRFASPEIVAALRADTGVPGLMLTGQDVVSCGFMGAMFGGVVCGSAALKRNLFGDLIKLNKKIAKQK